MPTVHDGSIWVDDLLERLERLVVASKVYAADAVWVFLGDPADLLAHPPRESFLTIAPSSLAPHQPTIDGGGNELPALHAHLTLTQFARVLTDQQNRDKDRVREKSRGLATAMKKLFACLQLWDGAGADGHSPLVEPGRLAGDVRFNGRRLPFGWASVESTWELKFTASFS